MAELILPLIKLGYLVAAALFVVGLKMMSHPRSAKKGNLVAGGGMALALAGAIGEVAISDSPSFVYLAVGLAIGGVLGTIMAQRVQMTQMPQFVGLFNGLGGAASVLVALAELIHAWGHNPEGLDMDVLIATGASGLIGGVTFSGSMIAVFKLQELKAFKKPFALPMQQVINAGLFAVCVGLTVVLAWANVVGWWGWLALGAYLLLALVSLVLGVFLTSPIGGADMPVVIALLNSYSGLAAAATGFVIDNNVLIIAGSLVGASGVILTQLMCKAMNRSLVNVLFGVMEAGSSAAKADEVYATVRSTTAEDVAMILDGAQRVVFVPGYGMAVAQAQHAVRDLGRALEAKGATVEYAIHPVAGRMPGHMNVLLAEADIEYDKLKEMDDINPTFDTVDVAVVIGANDVVNPVARTDPKSPIAGMPILDVDKARTVIVIKRSLSPGFAGIPNPLFAAENALMYYGDGQEAVLKIVKALKEL